MENKRRITLLGVLLRKIGNHWGAMWRLHRKFNIAGKFIGWPIAVVISSVVMFFPAAMHFIFEGFMFICGGNMRRQFRSNLVKIIKMMDEKSYVLNLERKCRKANFAPFDNRPVGRKFKWDEHTIKMTEGWLREHHPELV